MPSMRATLSFVLMILVLTIELVLLVNPESVARVKAAEPLRNSATVSERKSKPYFDSDIKPIFQARCQPCHFQGGKVYDKLPFDKAETITKLGTKLFTRIKDEKEQQKIREFLDQQ